ncbi:hypothetical protein BJ508DRAFT_327581 [Ascobolus immersus RN42]|uniref:Uncharacterized protein n=1 Tax=Ascobolus immersus RN42 TaxID=1160509 RepID=A0A3N4I2F1_ASCIM|nr:hypothetical protein BJ508DRAFT_327581 [Ascobolus immersus RN42]
MDNEENIPKGLWPYSAKARFGIDAIQRRDRAKEEIHLVRIEWTRNYCYATRRMNSLLLCLEHPIDGYNPQVFVDWIWEEIQALTTIIKASTAFEKDGFNEDGHFSCESVQDLLQTCREAVDRFWRAHEAPPPAPGIGPQEDADALLRDYLYNEGMNSDTDDDDADLKEEFDEEDLLIGGLLDRLEIDGDAPDLDL